MTLPTIALMLGPFAAPPRGAASEPLQARDDRLAQLALRGGARA